ncbi:hypothetical protein KC865_03065 [Candidatus Kaiserbacteria bacterium]|nr:hypothetical protein [Candidatus Kaiserbacteria bacterium]USN91926.1 MAG: hypothetical protein H6782_03560 [Candidatus Nomurabacteria bacterium]
MEKYITLEKSIGETPLSCAEAYRAKHPELEGVAMAYAGRLDPMASGKLLILLGEECKNQKDYHNLDKEYDFSVLLGIESDSLDVLGRLKTCKADITVNSTIIFDVIAGLVGEIELPYPRFSSKTVRGKPLHTWTLEGKLDEIEIPTKTSTVYGLEFLKAETLTREEIYDQARAKIDTIPPVTDLRKAIGNDFRRVDVRADWENFRVNPLLPNTYFILSFTCTASSGSYMRSLASVIAKKLNTCGLAWHIHRTKIGVFNDNDKAWRKEF